MYHTKKECLNPTKGMDILVPYNFRQAGVVLWHDSCADALVPREVTGKSERISKP